MNKDVYTRPTDGGNTHTTDKMILTLTVPVTAIDVLQHFETR